MSNFNGTVFILSPGAEEQYTEQSNNDYAKNWLDKKSEEEGRGLFSLFIKPGSGSLDILVSDKLKEEKDFLTEDLYSMVMGEAGKQSDFLQRLEKNLDPVFKKLGIQTSSSAETTQSIQKLEAAQKTALENHTAEAVKAAEAHASKLQTQLTEQKEAFAQQISENSSSLNRILSAVESRTEDLDAKSQEIDKLLEATQQSYQSLQQQIQEQNESIANAETEVPGTTTDSGVDDERIKDLIRQVADESGSDDMGDDGLIETIRQLLPQLLQEQEEMNPEEVSVYATTQDFEEFKGNLMSQLNI